jgi:hypothetical protein
MTAGFQSTDFKVSTSDGRNFVLLEPVVFVTQLGAHITIPAGATSDGASTPPALWPEIPPFGIYWKAAFFHDYLYRATQASKSECDALLLEAMQSLGVDSILAKTIYEGVALGGQSSFDADRAAQSKLP